MLLLMIRKDADSENESRHVLYNYRRSYTNFPSWYTMDKLLYLNMQDLAFNAQLLVSLLLKFELY